MSEETKKKIPRKMKSNDNKLLSTYPQLKSLIKDLPDSKSTEFYELYFDGIEAALNHLLKTDAVGDSGYLECFTEDPIGPLRINWKQEAKLNPNATVLQTLNSHLIMIGDSMGFW